MPRGVLLRPRSVETFLRSLPNILGYWPLTEDVGSGCANEISGAGVSTPGGWLGATGVTFGGSGQSGPAASFDGATSGLAQPLKSVSVVTPWNCDAVPCSFGGLFKCNGLTATDQWLMAQRTGGVVQCYSARLQQTSGNTGHIRCFRGGAAGNSVNSNDFTITPGTWYAWTITIDASNVTFYINGVQTGQGASGGVGSLGASTSADQILIGVRSAGAADQNFSGQLQHFFLVYNRAMSAAEALGFAGSAGLGTGGGGLQVARTVRNPSRYAAMIIGAAPVLYWRCNEASGNLTDSSGNANTGVVAGGINYAQGGIPGDPGFGAVLFNGTTGIAASAGTVIASGAISIEAWLNPAAIQAQNTRIFGNNAGGNAGFRFLVGSNGNAEVDGFSKSLGFTTNPTVAVGSWVHIVAVCDGANPYRIYRNGVLEGTSAALGAFTAAVIQLGGGQGFFANYYAQHMAVYSRVLAPSEVREHYLVGSTAPSARTLVS